jgi:hypothetical protein
MYLRFSTKMKIFYSSFEYDQGALEQCCKENKVEERKKKVNQGEKITVRKRKIKENNKHTLLNYNMDQLQLLT